MSKRFRITQSITERQDDSLRIFFNEVSKIRMIDSETEIELAKRIKNGDKSAANKLVEANLRFCISVAKQYQGKGLPLVDLIQFAIMGALEATQRWNPERKVKFISYAVWWIRQSIVHALTNHSRTVRIPMNQILTISKINKTISELEQEYNRTPCSAEIASKLEIPEDKINFATSSVNKSLSLDEPFKDEDVGSLIDVIPNRNSESSDFKLVENSVTQRITNILNKLSNRESDIIRMHFGIGVEPMTLDAIGCRFGLGAERVRQLVQSTLEKLKNKYSKELKELL